MKIDPTERIFRVLQNTGRGKVIVSRFEQSRGYYYDSWSLNLSQDIQVGYPKLTLEEAKTAVQLLGLGAEIHTTVDGADIELEIK